MAWYPGATKMELQPESDAQPAIKPTQFILHSIVAPWTPRRTYEYWRDSTNLESHFGLGYDGSLGQFIGTETRADANGPANRRSDGTGAVSLESASNLQASDPWTDEQVEAIIQLGVWLHEKHGIPLRICRSSADPGYGYHRLHTAWNPDAHSCPGDSRVKQFREVVFPGIVARATGKTNNPPQEDDMDPVDVWAYKGKGEKADAYAYLRGTNGAVRSLSKQVAGLTATVKTLADKLGDDVDTATVVAAVEKAITDAVVKVDVDITGVPNQES
ncbi:hypothetical protein GCM10010348_78580 [Streptomyces anthocyanicus]|uniref:peptidoglycan recognition protein family protein n=1 Tax=Streptomyces anthocyanicus TaxID=68174 RepID=UPI001876AE31|nr:N-acetylmuramoyl-L-alanine amidase [Streptomyces anthocyanicus]GHC39529.1 hypothetical protein GCM10010348_78580 [Streptomyces anthocyanicus]